MSAWDRVRAGCILVLALAVAASVGTLLFHPALSEPEPPAPVFPAQMHAPGWRALAPEKPAYRAPATHRYRQERGAFEIELELQFISDLPIHYVGNPMLHERYLHRGELPLDAGLHFTVNSRGKIIPNFKTETPRLASVEFRDGGVGFWNGEGRLHLSTVLAADGERAMTRPRIARDMYLDHLSIRRIWRWLGGGELLIDRRCVLIHCSLPEAAVTAEEGKRLLAAALEEWTAAHPIVFPPAAPGR